MWENYIEEEAGEAEPVDGLSDAFLSFLSLSYDVNLKLEWRVWCFESPVICFT